MALLTPALWFNHVRYKKRLHKQGLKMLRQEKELELLQTLMQWEENERGRVAKELHDGVAGMLAAAKMHFSSMPGADELVLAETYQHGMQLLNGATHEIRKISHNLLPSVLRKYGLDEALLVCCNSVSSSNRVQIQYDSLGGVGRFHHNFELLVYRVVQELINTIIKHSRATKATVQLSQRHDVLSISIEDNGVAFAGDEAKWEDMGLRSLQSRVNTLNGRLELQSSRQSGVNAYLEFEIAGLKMETSPIYE